MSICGFIKHQQIIQVHNTSVSVMSNSKKDSYEMAHFNEISLKDPQSRRKSFESKFTTATVHNQLPYWFIFQLFRIKTNQELYYVYFTFVRLQ